MCIFGRCDFLLEHNIIRGHNATSSDDNIIANSLPAIHISKDFHKHGNGKFTCTAESICLINFNFKSDYSIFS